MEKLTKEETLNRICEREPVLSQQGSVYYETRQINPDKLAEFLTETINNLISK